MRTKLLDPGQNGFMLQLVECSLSLIAMTGAIEPLATPSYVAWSRIELEALIARMLDDEAVAPSEPAPSEPAPSAPPDAPPPSQERLRSWELPAVTVEGTAPSALFEEQLIGSCHQPRWTATRRFPTTRVYVMPEGKVEMELWARATFDKHGNVEYLHIAGT